MKILYKGLLGLAVLLVSGTLFAACPQIGGHTLAAHSADNSSCTYVANQANFAAMHNPKLCAKGFILTDPHYKVVHCKLSEHAHRCVCTIKAK